MSNLVILNTPIRQMDGLYSLNDLHHASGGEERHKPKRFVRLNQTRGLITEIEQGPNMVLALKAERGGKNPGTYVCKELVVAYAAWISPTLHLAVIRAFLEKQDIPLAPAPAAQPPRHSETNEITLAKDDYIRLLEDNVRLMRRRDNKVKEIRAELRGEIGRLRQQGHSVAKISGLLHRSQDFVWNVCEAEGWL